MTRNRGFVNSFWETDFIGTVGFDCLCKHVRDGQKTCRDIEEFFKKRAKAEQSYSKALNVLVKAADGREESGDLGLSWQELKGQTEKVAHFHENAGSEYSRLAEEIAKFTDDLKQICKPVEEKVKESQRAKKNAFNKMTDLQKTYNTRCREKDQHDNQLSVAIQSVTMSTKELEKIKTKAEKSKEAMEQSDIVYKQAVEILERTRSSWETDMEDACELIQQQEEERISFLRNQLWKCTNVDSQLCVDWDESCEKVRARLENCNVDNEIQEFIDNNFIGSTRPAPILYENYFGEKANGKSDVIKASPRAQRKLLPLPPVPPTPTSNTSLLDVYSYATVTPDALPSSPEPEEKYKVSKSYFPQSNSSTSLVLRRGDIVRRVGMEMKGGLIKVKMENSSAIGFVPKDILEPV